MTHALYTTKTPTNQALTLRPWGNRITLPILLPVLLIGLFILSACGGGSKAAATPNEKTTPVATCETNPFLDSCDSPEHATERDRIIKECIAGSNPADRPSCANAIAKNSCIGNPHAANCATDFADYVVAAQMERQTFCRMDDNAGDVFCRPAVTSICDGNIFDGICNSSAASQESFCRKGTNADDNPNCASVVKDICDRKPLFDALCTPDVNAQRAFCRMGTNAADDPVNCGPVVVGICADDPFDGLCAVDNVARADFCRKGDNLTIRAGDCAPVAIRVCADRVFDGLCRDHAVQRSNLCAGSLTGITAAGGVPGDCVAYSATICGVNGSAGANPFAPICSRTDANSQFTTNTLSRDAFCRADLFNPLCDNGYTDAQVSVCHRNGVPTDVNPRCAIIIANNCPFTDGERSPACYTLPTARAAAGSRDPEVNYVEGNATGLKLVFSQTTVPANISGFESGVLRLSDLDSVTTDDGHGVAWATFINSQSEYVEGGQGKQRFYAGLLSTTALASPKISRNVKRAEWTGKIALYARDTNRTTPFGFTLLVDFDGNGGTLRANINIPTPGNNNINDLFIIDGAFNNAGVVYGYTSLNGLNVRQESRSTTGSLTGQIGEKGVVAAFISDGKGLGSKGLGNYVGGFVASNPYNGNTDTVACGSGSTDTPFDPRCADNDAVRIMLCSTRDALAGTGDTLVNNCADDRDVVFAICTSSGQYANPFDSVICTDNDLNVQNAFLDNCRSTDTSLRDGADCATVTACAADAFATTCDADTYANSRSSLLDVCNTQALRGIHDLPGCENALLNCATATPDANCGALATTYCAGAAGRTITGDTSTCPARVTAYCVDYPINPICADVAENTTFVAADLKTARETFCRADILVGFTNGIRTSQPDPNCIPTIAVYCGDATGDEIYDNLCDVGLFTQDFIGETCDSETRDASLNTLCDSTSDYSVARLKQCSTTNFAHDKCRAGNDPRNFVGATGRCGADIHSTASSELICKIDPQILRTVGALCGTDDTIGLDPFDDLCDDNDLYRPDAVDSARTTARKLGQESFCREEFRAITRAAIAANTTPVYTASANCAPIITAFCPATPDDELFDDLCDGGAYLANRATHCETAFTHAKCATNQMNMAEAELICGTESAPGTNPFNDVCKSSSLSPNITAMSLLATQRAFCRADLMNNDCENTIKGFCDGNTDITILDDLCDGADYTDARLGYCIHPNADHMECGTVANNKMAITTLCGDAENTGTNPFSIACTEAFSLRIQIDALCGGGRNADRPLCMDENAVPAIDRASVTASQENFCRGDITMPACENTIADFCDLAFDTDILDPLCGGAGYQDMRLMTCLNLGIDHPSCNGTAGVIATLCPTDGGARNELCPAIVDHASYLTSVDDLDVNDDTRSGAINSQAAAGVINKNTVHVPDNLRDDDYDVDDDVERAIGFATDAPATLITGKSDSTGLDFGTLPPARTTIRNGGDPVQITVDFTNNFNTAYKLGATAFGYALASANIITESGSDSSTETKLYAGLLSNSGFGTPSLTNQGLTTKLGVAEPTLDITPTGIWRATMNLIMAGGNATVAGATFDLSVDFKAQTIKTLASRTAQFGIVGADFAEPQYTASDSPVVPLFGPDGEPYYRRDSRGDEIIVGRGDIYTDCYGNRLNPGSKVRLCEGGGLPDYNSNSFGGRETLAANRFGNPTISTRSKPTTGRLTVDASFTPTGLVYGDITIQTGFLNDDGNFIGKRGGDLISSAGRIVGQINDGQLIGAFASNAGSAEDYVGGFTATPTATVTHFAKGAANGLDLTSPNSNVPYKIAGTENGFAIATTSPSSIRNLHAGLLTGTNLGNPLLDNSMSGIWNAKLEASYISAGIAHSASSEFKLSVDFDAKTIKTLENRGASFVLSSSFDVSVTYTRDDRSTFTTQESSVGVITVDGQFSDAGRVTGTTHFQIGNPNNPAFGGGTGILTGLIGEDGLVAAFVSDAGSANAYAGGFTATRAGAGAIFTAGGTDSLTLTGTEAAAATVGTPHPLGITFNEDYVITGTTNGFALASENIANGQVKLYAGLLSDIDLGNPLFDNRATGIWSASLNAIILRKTGDDTSGASTTVTTAVSSTFDLRVDFDTRTLKTVQDSAMPFTFDTGFKRAIRTADNRPVTALTLNSSPLYLKDSSGIDIRVQEGQTITNCATRVALNVGDRIPLCEGGGSFLYSRDGSDNVITKNGIPLIKTESVSSSGRIIVDGRFTSSGVISGKTSLDYAGISESGTLTGVIGAKGAVAAFVGDANSGSTYVGGFTATAGVCTIGASLFDKTACPDTNSAAKNLRLQLCLNRDPAAMPFATNCGSADEIAFIAGCLEDPTYDLGCTTGAVAECLNDPYAFNCRSASYTPARTAHLDTCGVATAPPDPRCVNLRVQLSNCSSAQPNPGCGTLVNDFCFGGAGRVIEGKTTCVENIRLACATNALHPRCRDLGVFTTTETHEAHIVKQHDFCAGDLTNLPTGATASDCRTLGITLEICGSPIDVGTNPFATICSDAMGNPYSETRELKIIQTFFCQESGRVANDDCDTLQEQLDTEFEQIGGRTPYWADNAIREVATPVLNDDGSIKTTPHPDSNQARPVGDNPVTKLVQFPINITPAGKIRRDNADVNYIVGGVSELDLTALIELDDEGQPKVDSTGAVINHNPITNGIANRGGLSLNTAFTNSADLKTSTDAGSGFAFASATFAVRTLRVEFGDSIDTNDKEFTNRTFGGTKLYTGLLSGTNVGAPLSDFQTEVEWTGKINGLYGVGDVTGVRNTRVNSYTDKEFTLLVSFYGNFGTIRNKNRIVLDSNTFDIDGRFTDRGLIYGDTELFRGGNLIASGSLTGLIGADGAVATFVSDDENPAKEEGNCCTSNFGNYVGGFVALPPASPPTAPRADFEAWRDSFQAPNIPLTRAFGTQEFTAANDKQYFIQGTVSSLIRANDNFANEYGGNNPITLTLDNAFNDDDDDDDDNNNNNNYDGYDGIAYLRGTGKRAYAGILLGTALGAPLADVAGVTAQWAGVFRSSSHIISPTSFTLTVGFEASGGTLDALVTSYNNRRAGINGTFNADGVISGEVIYGEPVNVDTPCLTSGVLTVTESCFKDASGSLPKDTATLTGLIGEQGAVAAFIGDISVATNNRGWAGGFVATPDFCGSTPDTVGNPNCNTNRADWVGSFGGTAPPATIAAAAQTGVFGGFLNLSGGTIAAGDLKTAPNGDTPASSRFLNRGTANLDGFIFISGYHGANHQVFIGIRPTTNLARPLTAQPAISAWPGRYYDSIADASAAVTFNIDFSNRSIGTSIADTVINPPTFDLGFTRAGVITGTVTKNSLEATARGLIGQQGLIGAFVDTSPPTSGNVFHGGFVATNPGHSN